MKSKGQSSYVEHGSVAVPQRSLKNNRLNSHESKFNDQDIDSKIRPIDWELDNSKTGRIQSVMTNHSKGKEYDHNNRGSMPNANTGNPIVVK